MLQSLLLPSLAGVAAGLAAALAEAERLRVEGRREAESAKSDLLLTAKMETLKLREDLDREVQRRREEWERLERRAEERARTQERKLEEIEAREGGAVPREDALSQRELSLRNRESEADRLVQ